MSDNILRSGIAQSLADLLMLQMIRVRDEVMPAYIEIGPAGTLALALMRNELDKATRAFAENDITKMVQCYESLKGFNT